MGACYEQDVRELAVRQDIPWERLDGSVVVVTGATGLIGGLVVRALARRNKLADAGIRVVAPVRNLPRATSLLSAELGAGHVRLVTWDAATGAVPDVDACDYVIHCASNTDSRLMVERPVDTVLVTVEGARAMLELARRCGARLCFASSMEVYGAGAPEALDERRGGELDAMAVRSSYPHAKQLAETLCAAYAAQHATQAVVARLAQTFGPGIAASDRRVFAEFARCCRAGRDIALLTDGSKSNMYAYTTDAAAALLLLAVRGQAGEAYNVANEQTFCSVWEMARMVADSFGMTTQVTRVVDEEAARRYAVSGRIWLDTSKLRALGWTPTRDLPDMYERMMADWDDEAAAAPAQGTR